MARFTYPYTRKTYFGGLANPDQGVPSLNASVEAAFPTYPFGISCFDTVLNIIFGQQLTAGEETTLNGVYTAWDPETTPQSTPAPGLLIPAPDANFNMKLVLGANLTAERTLTLTAGDVSRTLNISGVQGALYYTDASGNFVPLAPGTSGQYLRTSGGSANPVWSTPAGAGDVLGPAGATDNAIVRFDLGTGKLLQNSGVLLPDDNTIDLPSQAAHPAAPASGRMDLYPVTLATEVRPSWRAPVGTPFLVQPLFVHKNVVLWLPETGTTIRVVGMPVTSVGTVSPPPPATGSLLAGIRRWRLTSAATDSRTKAAGGRCRG